MILAKSSAVFHAKIFQTPCSTFFDHFACKTFDSLYKVGTYVEAGDKWYEHEPESVLENEDYKILWNFSIQSDHVIEAQRSDLVVVDKKERSCKIIDFADPGDSRIEEKEKDKIEKYHDLGRDYRKYGMLK